MTIRDYPVAIIGAGPVGMAAAAQLTRRKIPFKLFEAGASVGASLLDWEHIQVFSPWKYNIDKAAEQLLKDINWQKPDEDGLPTGGELVRDYLLPLSLHPEIDPHLNLNTKVLNISRRGTHKVRTAGRDKIPFLLRVQQGNIIRHIEASGIIDASGTWFNPNPIGAGGIYATGEKENQDKIAYRIPDILGKDKSRYANKTVLVVGGGHSAINSLLNLASLKDQYPETRLHWALLTDNLEQVYGGGEDDALEARGALGIKIKSLVQSGVLKIHTPYFIHEIDRQGAKLVVKGYQGGTPVDIDQVDEIIANTGARPDLEMTRELRVQYDAALECVPQLAELIDPNLHSCGTVRPHGELELKQPEPDFYVVGVKSYGRAPTFLMATGYEQVRSIAAWWDGDLEAARKVELDLPETGVCSTNNSVEGAACCGTAPNEKEANKLKTDKLKTNTMKTEEKTITETVEASGCCGGAPTTNADACCALDEEKKAEGEAGCGCNSAEPAAGKKAPAASCC